MIAQRYWVFAASVGALVLSIASADACFTMASRDLNDVKHADIVLSGRIKNYKIVRDEEFRKKRLVNPNLSSDDRALYGESGSILSDYGRFEVDVDEVLAGEAPATVIVTWDNSTFGEPKAMDAGPWLMALRKSGSNVLPLRGPSATVLPDPEPGSLKVLQAPCAAPFLFDPKGDRAQIVRAILAGKPYTASAVDGGSGRF